MIETEWNWNDIKLPACKQSTSEEIEKLCLSLALPLMDPSLHKLLQVH